jgi:hypothetical protein
MQRIAVELDLKNPLLARWRHRYLLVLHRVDERWLTKIFSRLPESYGFVMETGVQ